METLTQDVRYGFRMLLKNPAFAFVAVTALALGIGANTAIFSVVYGVLLRPLPYRNADRLSVTRLSVPDFRDLKEETKSFDAMAIWASNLYNLAGTGEAEQVLGAVVSPEFLPILGQAAIGRTFRPEEDREPLVVLSHGFWQRRFGGDPAALGQSIDLSGRSHIIVGVMPADFQFPSAQFELWVTFGSALANAPEQSENRQLRIFRCLARLKLGVPLELAQAEVDALSRRLQKEYPNTNAGVQIKFTPLYERIVGDVRPALLILLGTVGFVLLIACANVANLMLARTAARQREIAVRSALGASRGRLIRQLLTESLLLASAGGFCGLLLARWGIDLLLRLRPGEIPRLSTIGLSFPVLLFTLSISLATGILFGVVPSLQASRRKQLDTLKEAGRGLAGSPWGGRIRGALVVAEVALSLIVLIGAGLLIRSFARLMRTDAGFVADNLLTTNIQLIEYKDPQRRAAVMRDVLARLAQLPGVQAAGGGSGLPAVTAQRATRFAIEGDIPSQPVTRSAYFLAVSPDYFRALGTPLFAGRFFTDLDREGAAQVVIINRTLAHRLFPDGNPAGKRLKLVNPEQSGEWRTIVGVVGDVHYSGLDDPGEAAIYTPFSQTPFLWNYVMLRTSGDPSELVASARSALFSLDPNLRLARFQTMSQLVSESVAQPRLNMALLSSFALLALLLAAVGLYGVISYTVTLRTHEIGIRMALGARAADVLSLVVAHGMVLALIGIGLGVAGALAVTRLISGLLFGISATDPVTFAVTALFLAAVALLASYVPARRATRVDPIVALRHE